VEDSVDPDAILAAAAAGVPTSAVPVAGLPADPAVRAVRAVPVDRGVRVDPADVRTGAVPGVMTTGVVRAAAADRIAEAIVDRIGVRRSRKPCPRGSRSISFRIRPASIR
jgi:hypothetical protein